MQGKKTLLCPRKVLAKDSLALAPLSKPCMTSARQSISPLLFSQCILFFLSPFIAAGYGSRDRSALRHSTLLKSSLFIVFITRFRPPPASSSGLLNSSVITAPSEPSQLLKKMFRSQSQRHSSEAHNARDSEARGLRRSVSFRGRSESLNAAVLSSVARRASKEDSSSSSSSSQFLTPFIFSFECKISLSKKDIILPLAVALKKNWK